MSGWSSRKERQREFYNHAFWLTRDQSEAEDLVQETFSKALRSFDSFQPGTNFKAWIFPVLRNTFLTSRTGIATTRTVSKAALRMTVEGMMRSASVCLRLPGCSGTT
jgi:RNA polymerase sigma factor (sigma-70 family)